MLHLGGRSFGRFSRNTILNLAMICSCHALSSCVILWSLQPSVESSEESLMKPRNIVESVPFKALQTCLIDASCMPWVNLDSGQIIMAFPWCWNNMVLVFQSIVGLK